MTQPMTLIPPFPPPDTNPCPPGWREVQPDERVGDVHECIGGVVGALRRWDVEPHFPDDMAPVVEAMAAVLRLLNVEPAAVRYESYVVA